MRLNPLVETKGPAIDVGAGELGWDRDIGEGSRLEEPVCRKAAKISAVAVAAGANVVIDFGEAAPGGVVAQCAERPHLALDAD